MKKPLSVAEVRRQIGSPVRRQATPAQLDYLASLITELSNAGKIRWERGPGRGYTVYDASQQIDSLKRLKESGRCEDEPISPGRE